MGHYRNITVASTSRSGQKDFSTDVTTWGQLTNILRDDFGDVSAMRAVIKETRNDLSSPDSILPEGDCIILLTPRQIKAGLTDVDAVKILEEVKDAFVQGIDDIIYCINCGDYDKATIKAKEVTKSPSVAQALNDLKNGNF